MNYKKANAAEESSVLFFLRIVISNWKFLISLYTFVGIFTVIVLLLLPKWYKSSATLVIQNDNASPLSGVLSQFSSFGLSLGDGGTNVETYIQYVFTRKMYDSINRKFNLQKEYEVKTKDDLYDAIFNNLTVTDNENQTITISFAVKEKPELAREIVEFIVEQLQKISLEVEKAQAKEYRTYIEGYYLSTKQKLRDDEDALVDYQNLTGILELETQAKATIEGIAELEKEKITLQIKKDVIKNMLNNPSSVSEVNAQITAIDSSLKTLDNTDYKALISLNTLPENGAEYLRLKRDITVGSQVSEFLRLQYEQALLDEQKISSNFYVIDPPYTPEKRFKPARTKTLVIVMFFTVLLSLILVRMLDFYHTNKASIKLLLS